MDTQTKVFIGLLGVGLIGAAAFVITSRSGPSDQEVGQCMRNNILNNPAGIFTQERCSSYVAILNVTPGQYQVNGNFARSEAQVQLRVLRPFNSTSFIGQACGYQEPNVQFAAGTVYAASFHASFEKWSGGWRCTGQP